MDEPLRLVACLLASLPAGWFASAMRERVPPGEPVLQPLLRAEPSRGYLAVQVTTTALFIAAGVRFATDPLIVLVAYLVLFTSAVALFFIDLDVFRLPDRIVFRTLALAAVLLTAASVLAGETDRIGYAVAGAAIYFGALLLAHLILPSGMGFGDVKLAALLGLYVGWLGTSVLASLMLVFYAMFAGIFAGGVAGIVMLPIYGRRHSFPYGPFLIAGSILVIMFSTSLL